MIEYLQSYYTIPPSTREDVLQLYCNDDKEKNAALLKLRERAINFCNRYGLKSEAEDFGQCCMIALWRNDYSPINIKIEWCNYLRAKNRSRNKPRIEVSLELMEELKVNPAPLDWKDSPLIPYLSPLEIKILELYSVYTMKEVGIKFNRTEAWVSHKIKAIREMVAKLELTPQDIFDKAP